jgi:hypothetical protein
MEINPPKIRGYTALNIKEPVPTQCMAAFSMDLRTNNHYIPHTVYWCYQLTHSDF